MSEKLTLNPYMRTLLLKEICRRMDIADYCRYLHNITFTENIQNTLTGDCPYCGGHQSFVINEVTGRSFCMACRDEGDLLALLCHLEGRDLTSIQDFLTGYLQEAERPSALRRGGAA